MDRQSTPPRQNVQAEVLRQRNYDSYKNPSSTKRQCDSNGKRAGRTAGVLVNRHNFPCQMQHRRQLWASGHKDHHSGADSLVLAAATDTEINQSVLIHVHRHTWAPHS